MDPVFGRRRERRGQVLGAKNSHVRQTWRKIASSLKMPACLL